MKVILDANIIIADYRFNSTNSKVLLESLKKGNIDLYVPKIVLEEVFNKFEETLSDSKSKIDKELAIIKRKIGVEKSNKIDENFIKNEVSKYKSYIEKLFKENKINLLDYPNTPHERIVYKAIKKIKPFNENEKGYRDALIWENVKSLIPKAGADAANPNVVFITNDKNDFCEKGSDLHKDLVKELKISLLDSESIIIKNLNEFSNDINKLFFEQAESFKNKIEGADLADLLLMAITEKLDGRDISYLKLPYYNLDLTVRHIEKVDNIKIKDSRKLNSSEYLIDLTCNVEMEIDFYVEKSDHRMNDNVTYTIEDFDVNDHMMWASEEINLKLQISLVLDNDYNVSSIQMNGMSKSGHIHLITDSFLEDYY